MGSGIQRRSWLSRWGTGVLHRAVKERGWQVEKRRSDARTFEYRLV
ncbi:MAG: hypothetical protein F6K42_11940 [Leptolyngbya sp. SIO1D8]|nr:hypothetical protein [Leptolyngbya sp. SIO1D8]